MRIKSLLTCVILTALLTTVGLPAWGHGVDMYARVEGLKIVGTLTFADGTPVANAPVRAYAPEGSLLDECLTDGSGAFELPLRYHERYRLVGEAGPGHRGLFTVSKDETPESLPAVGELPSPNAPDLESAVQREHGPATIDISLIEAAVAKQIGPLRDELHQHESNVRFRDVLGGIGYLFGLMGLYVIIKRRPHRDDSA